MSAVKKILLLDTGNEWGGGTNSMIELLKRLDRQRFAVTCCFYKDYRRGQDGRLLSEELAAIGIPLVILPTTGQPLWAKLAKELTRGALAWSSRLKRAAVRAIEMRWRVRPRAEALRQLLVDGGFDLLYMNNQPASNLEGFLAGEAAGVPVVQHCRIEPTLHADDVALINRVAASVICVSQGVADVLAVGKVQPRRLRVVHNAIDVQAVLPPVVDFPRSGRPLIGTVGQLTARKGIPHLLQALAGLRHEGIVADCVILGEGPQKMELEAISDRLGLGGQVHFVGFQAQPLAWVQAMDVCVLCSSKEGLPRVVLEAMLAGKPVVGSDVTGTRELIVHEETGLLYAFGDIAALTAALRRLLGDAPLRARMGAAGRARVADGFSIEAYVAGVTAVLNEALA
ncbi:glycosyltransferase [Dechloromonas sp.]|uniref:glycosyltransferase n=1 Tax=Dechloromonas sp. TaxID=1917218 RepID=UPI00121F8099|nr:glycosyltransferase [Dechloromonas sp.]MBU3698319.1 glycosyltransferase [Dechloromonas sp.]TEX47602.1 MAG: glycosyltransferase [Rhodocyclaceae bacterium]